MTEQIIQKDIHDKLKIIIKPYVNDENVMEQLHEETDFIKDLNINSAHLVDIILDIEEVFDIEIDDESAEKMLTVKEAIRIINEKITDRK